MEDRSKKARRCGERHVRVNNRCITERGETIRTVGHLWIGQEKGAATVNGRTKRGAADLTRTRETWCRTYARRTEKITT